MKRIKKYLSIYLSIFIIIISVCNFSVNATSGGGGYFTEDSFSWTEGAYTNALGSWGAFTMEDDSHLQSGMNYYIKVEDGKCITCDAGELITNCLNYKLGISMSSQVLTAFISAYLNWNAIGGAVNFNQNFVLKDGVIVGYALNNITGCRVAYAQNDDVVPVPSDLPNNIYEYFNNVYIIENPDTPDFINVPNYDKASALRILTVNTPNYQNLLNKINSTSDTLFCFSDYNNGCVRYYSPSSRWEDDYCVYADSLDNYLFVATTGFNDCISAFNLTSSNNQVPLSTWLASTNSFSLQTSLYDSTTMQSKYLDHMWSSYSNNTSNGNYANGVRFTCASTKTLGYNPSGGYITVYKNGQIVTNIQNNVYQKNYYTSSKTENYNTSNDNSYNTNIQNINNSTSNNTNIYNQTSTTNNENITNNNYQYDYSQNNSNNTTIINNYYGDNGDNSGGGGSDDDDDDDDSIWDALLKALGDFLKKIGELLATILTGIISICTSVLDAIASIASSFTGITDFIGSIIAFIPSDIVAVLTLGITLAVLISLIKIFRG